MKKHTALILSWAICMLSSTNALILNNDQIKALKLARPFLGNGSDLKLTKTKSSLFHRNQERKLSLVESSSNDSPSETMNVSRHLTSGIL